MTPIDPDLFREAMSRFASGVTVVTSARGEDRVGITASSFVSVSKDPPLVLVCLTRAHPVLDVIEDAGAFAVNILGAHQLEAGLRFAGLRPETPNRFDGLGWASGPTGSPLLEGSLSSLDCRLVRTHDGGDHAILIGEVVHAVAAGDGPPLLYHQRTWRRPDPSPLPERVGESPPPPGPEE